MSYRIDKWIINPKTNQLIKDKEVIHVETKAMQVLNFLANRAGEIVTRKELMRNVWVDVFVSEDTLTRCISILRKVLEDSPTEPKIIQTIKSEGYRIIAPVEFMADKSNLNKPKIIELLKKNKVVFILSTLFLVIILLVYNQNNGTNNIWRKTPIATSKSDEMFPVISPDASRIAYCAYNDSLSKTDIYIKVADGSGKAIKITNSSGNETCPTWSPDGKYIAYNMIDGQNNGIYKISTLGGIPQKIGTPFETVAQQMAWSHDNKYIAYSDRKSSKDSYSIYLMEVVSGKKTKLTAPTKQHWGDYSPSFSPDDEKVSFIRGISAGTHDVYVYDFKAKASTRLTFQTRRTSGQIWSADGSTIIYSHEDGNTGEIWSIPAKGGNPIKLNIEGIRPSIDKSGRYLVVEDWNYDYDIFSIDLLNPSEKIPFSIVNSTYEDFDPIYNPSGTQMTFISNRSGSYELWLLNNVNNEVFMLTHFGGSNYMSSPSWSIDGTKIIFTFFTPKGNADIYTIDLNSNEISPLIDSKFNEISPNYSSDGKGVYFGSNRSSKWQIWYMNILNKNIKQITKNGGYSPLISEYSDDIYYSKYDIKGIWKYSARDSTEIKVIDDLHLFDWANFDIDINNKIYYVSRQSASSSTFLKHYDLNDRTKILLNTWFSINTRITLSHDNSKLFGTQTVNKDIDVVLYRLDFP